MKKNSPNKPVKPVQLLYRSLAEFVVRERLSDWISELSGLVWDASIGCYVTHFKTPHDRPSLIRSSFLLGLDGSIGVRVTQEAYVPLRVGGEGSLPTCSALRVFLRDCRLSQPPLGVAGLKLRLLVRVMYELQSVEPAYVWSRAQDNAIRGDVKRLIADMDRGQKQKEVSKVLVDYPGAF